MQRVATPFTCQVKAFFITHVALMLPLKCQYSQTLCCQANTKLTPHTPSASPTLEAAVKTAGLIISHLQTKLSGAFLDFNFLILVFLHAAAAYLIVT